MTVRLVPFTIPDMELLNVQPAQWRERQALSDEGMAQLAELPYSYTAMVKGRPICCGGLIEMWPGRALAWTFLDADCGRWMVGLHRAVKGVIESAPFPRVEAWVDPGHEAGHVWMRLLGFEQEAECMSHFYPDGRDCSLYARVR